MAKDGIPCPICGKEFVPCKTDIPGVFNYRRIACSWTCAEIYVERLEEERRQAREAKNNSDT